MHRAKSAQQARSLIVSSVAPSKALTLTGTEWHCWLTLPTGHTARISQVLFSPNGLLLMSASSDDSVKLWDIRQWQHGSSSSTNSTAAVPGGARATAAATFYAQHGGITALATDFGRMQVFTGGWDGLVRAWDLRKLSTPLVQLAGHQGPITCLHAFSTCLPGAASGTAQPVVVSGSEDWTLRVWCLSQGKDASAASGGASVGSGTRTSGGESSACLATLIGHGGPITSMQVLAGAEGEEFPGHWIGSQHECVCSSVSDAEGTCQAAITHDVYSLASVAGKVTTFVHLQPVVYHFVQCLQKMIQDAPCEYLQAHAHSSSAELVTEALVYGS